MALQGAAPWVALGAAVFAAVLVGTVGLRTWRHWRRTRVTQQAAVALLAVHQERLETTIERVSDAAARVADGGDELAEELAELRADAAHLRWMFGQIPQAREQLTRELAELVLHSGGRQGADQDESDERP